MDDQRDDSRIIEMFWQRSDDAIRETQRKYHKLLLKISSNITSSPQDAEECINDTYLKLWSSIPPAKPDSLKSYAARIARNLAIDHYRKSVSNAQSEVIHICGELEEMLADGHDEYESSELRSLINQFLSTVDRETRVLFILRYWMSESISDLAHFLGLKESAVKMRLLRTREKARAFLNDGGINV